MSRTVCIVGCTLDMVQAGGHMWVYLNWALGLRALGCRIVWLEPVHSGQTTSQVSEKLGALKSRLEPFGLADSVVLFPTSDEACLPGSMGNDRDFEAATEADLLINIANKASEQIVSRFRRSALVDIDPGLTQIWVERSGQPLTKHDVYFSIGETIGEPDSGIPDCGVRWHYVPPPVHLREWAPESAESDAPFTTVSSWWGWYDVIDGEPLNNDKRSAFMALLDLPSRTPVSLELALALWNKPEHEDVELLRSHGWSIRHAFDVAGDPESYRNYLRRSRGEFSCAKASCSRLSNAWLSDRTLCYLALGKPAVVEHTGASRFLPDADGLLRFRGFEGAVRALANADENYDRHCRSARALIEEHFDSQAVLTRFLETALT
jgi:hypothetical protein